MARSKSGFCRRLLSEIKQVIYSNELRLKHKSSSRAFVRDRILTFPLVVLYIANFIKGSLQDEVDQFFQAILKLDVAKRVVTRSAICQARKKISYKVFVALLDVICRFLNDHVTLITFKGFRVFAMDGSTLLLPDKKELRSHFGQAKYSKSKARAIARISILHDVLNRITYDAIVGRYQESEQTMAWEHMETAQIPNQSLFLMDRGYISFHLLRHILDLGHGFCVRVKSNLKVITLLEQSGRSEGVFWFRPSSFSKSQLPKGSSLLKPFKVRVMRFKFGKETVYLMTNLLDQNEYAQAEFGPLYHQRWQVEESYKIKKCRLRLEDFSGFSPEIIYQDFHAKVFAECLSSALTLDVQEAVSDYCETTDDEYQVCLTQVLAKMKNTIVLLFLRKSVAPILEGLRQVFLQSLVAMVPGRKYGRKNTGRSAVKVKTPAMAYPNNR